MISLEQALQILDREVPCTPHERETVPVREALGRVLACDQASRLDLPPFDKSAMDGFAIAEGDLRGEYQLLETVPAGRVGKARLVPGTTVKVMTGSPVPAGTGRVIMLEHVEEFEGKIRVIRHNGRTNICRKAEDVRRGQTILSAGTTIGPVEIANLISCGVTEVAVIPRVRLAILSTGDELVDKPESLAPGKIMNSNGPLLAALAGKSGLEVTLERAVPDDRKATADGIREALEAADTVVISGGVSVGEYDFVMESLSGLGFTIHFSRVAIKPGKPIVFASRDDQRVFGLPGNPVSVYLTFHLYVMRAVCRRAGAPYRLREIFLPMGRDFTRRNAERRQFVPCVIDRSGTVSPVEFHGSAHLLGLTGTDGFFVVPEGITKVGTGEQVSFLSLKRDRG